MPATRAAQQAQVLHSALPYIQGFHGKTFVVRCGGQVMTDPALRAAFGHDLALLHLVGMRLIVVHGAGPRMVERLTGMRGSPLALGSDAAETTLVGNLLGKVNQDIVALINRHVPKAIGLSGLDGGMITARPLPTQPLRSPDLRPAPSGETGRIAPELIRVLQARGFIPVLMPVGVGPDGLPLTLDTDTVSSRLAQALGAEKLLTLTDEVGVLGRDGRLLPVLTANDIEPLRRDGTVHGGMLPKLDAVLDALAHGVRSAHIIDGRVPNALLLEALTSSGGGTMILPDRAPHFLQDSRQYLGA